MLCSWKFRSESCLRRRSQRTVWFVCSAVWLFWKTVFSQYVQLSRRLVSVHLLKRYSSQSWEQVNRKAKNSPANRLQYKRSTAYLTSESKGALYSASKKARFEEDVEGAGGYTDTQGLGPGDEEMIFPFEDEVDAL